MTALEIVRCGHLTSIQDDGRPGYARIGLARGGAMDPRALHLANALVGNAFGEAAIELAFLGAEILLHGGPARLALAGGRARMRRGLEPVADHTSLVLRDGETLTIGRAETGFYMMLAVEGGLDVPLVLASRSLDARAGIGGLDGRRLRAGDRLGLRLAVASLRGEHQADRLTMADGGPIRVVPGPQQAAFPDAAFHTLTAAQFVVSHAVDRMACRLLGPAIARVGGFEMISEPTTPGSIQIPPDGAPLVMLADAQTIGGYPKIGTVISADLPRLVQCPPGASIRFEIVSIGEAGRLAREASRHCADRLVTRPLIAQTPRLDRVADAVVSAVAADTWDARATG